ncbi:MAG: hypothetical protein IT495_09635 [Gammaproteobacteria bacterium]|nr:hypothetical protein [Gammaproteobacteria bacterium]
MNDLPLYLMQPVNATSLFFGAYAYYVPMTLYCVFASVAFLGLAGEPAGRRRTAWGLLILALPLFGGAAFLLLHDRWLATPVRRLLVWGGLALITCVLAGVIAQIVAPIAPAAL